LRSNFSINGPLKSYRRDGQYEHNKTCHLTEDHHILHKAEREAKSEVKYEQR